MADTEKQASTDNSIYYILGGVVLVAAVAGFFLLKPKGTTAPVTAPAGTEQAVTTPATGPITQLACEKQYYNPKVGFPEYYLSVEGVDTVKTGQVTCSYKISVNDKVVKTATATGDLKEDATRGGATFRCVTEALQLAKGVPTKVDVTVENPANTTVDCSQTFILP